MNKIFNFNPTGGLQLFQILRFGQLFIAGILLARSPIGFEAISAYETLLLISGLLSFFWVNGLIQSMLAEKTNNENALYFRTFIYALILSSVAALFFILAKSPLQLLLGKTEDIPYYFLFGLYILINGPGLLTEYIYLRKGNSQSIVLYAVLAFGIQLILLFIAAFFGNGAKDIIIAMILGAGIRFIWSAILSLRNGVHFSDFVSKPQIGLAFSLGLVALVGGSAEYIDGIIIRAWYGAENFVFFRYGARELPFTLLLANALSASFVLSISAKGLDISSLNEIKAKSLKLMHWLFPISIILLIVSPILYKSFFGEAYIESADIFNIYILLICSRLIFPQSILTGMGKGKIQLWISVIELIINIGLSLILLNLWGMAGVAIATVIAYMIEKLLLVCYLHYKHGIESKSYIPFREWISYVLILLSCFIFLHFFR